MQEKDKKKNVNVNARRRLKINCEYKKEDQKFNINCKKEAIMGEANVV